MAGLLFRQFWALFWKNCIILSKHPLLNVLRCFILPIAYGIFLAVAQLFLSKPNNYGMGTAIPVYALEAQFDGSMSLIWADGTDGTGFVTAGDIMSRVTSGFSRSQIQAVRMVDSPDDIPSACPQNFNLFSECFAAVAFNYIPHVKAAGVVNYTLRADAGLAHIDVTRHSSDFEERLLPLQWALDKAIIDLTTGSNMPTPLEWPYTIATNAEQARDIRLSYIRGLRTLLVLALFICYVGIAYQLPGAYSGERANLVTSHMKAMGLLDSSRIISWLASMSLAYLPAWIIVSLIWHYRIFTVTNGGLILVVHLLLGYSLASWSFFIAAPFGKSPQLAAVSTTLLAVVFAILALVYSHASTGAAFILTIVIPPTFYIFAIRAICGFENHLMPTNIIRGDPDNNLMLLPLIIGAIIDIFLWPYLAILWERRLYDAREPSSSKSWWQRRRQRSSANTVALPPDIAISVRNLGKTWSTSMFNRKKGLVTAIDDLTLDIPKYGIFVLLGSNGAGKSTALSIIGGLTGRSKGSVTFEGDVSQPPRGTLGIVPQKNVLFPELTCYQTLRVWAAVKRVEGAKEDDDIIQLLKDCDLEKKIHANAENLSGGQKRKLQLAVGLIGGSKIVLVDECTSGVDPLSRRALWRTLTSVRHERTIVFTTHFLDEADLLADHIAILAAPGKLVAEGSPVALKSSLGQGYSVQVTFQYLDKEGEKGSTGTAAELLREIRQVVPASEMSAASPWQVLYHLKAKDSATVERVLQLIDVNAERLGIASYDILSATIEDIFLSLMEQDKLEKDEQERGSTIVPEKEDDVLPVLRSTPDGDQTPEDKAASRSSAVESIVVKPTPLALTSGRPRPPLIQAFTIFHKRFLILRRSWLSPLLAVFIAVAGSCVPLFFMNNRPQSCTKSYQNATAIPLYLPTDPFLTVTSGSPSSNWSASVLSSPPGIIIDTLGASALTLQTTNITDNSGFIQAINQEYQILTVGGVSVNTQSNNTLFAWEATPPGYNGLGLLNLVSNILYNMALESSGTTRSNSSLIMANYQSFPLMAAGTLTALKWVAFFGATMSVYPAFFSLYVSRERRSSVQAMQLSNGLANPVGLWVGHLMFDSVFVVVSSTLTVIVWAGASNQFHGLGFFWLVLILYGLVAALFSYCVSLVMASPLSSWAASAGYQIIMFLLYLAGYLLTLTYAKTSLSGQIITIIHFTLSILSPVASVLRASLISVNLFSLLCVGDEPASASAQGDIMRYGGPILYLIVYFFVLLAILVYVDSGTLLPRGVFAARQALMRTSLHDDTARASVSRPDVEEEERLVSSSSDLLRVLHVTKLYGKNTVVDNVTFGASEDTIFALLGPNGAGKTTTFNVIRGDVIPDKGDVFIKGVSVIHNPRTARLSLGVCPQFTAIDSQLTVREHLMIYGRLKGLRSGVEIRDNIDALLRATTLTPYADRLASKLSGGNQRKLSLAIAMIGNPSVILIDEFSTGIDAKMKRDMWSTLRNVAVGKAVIITTHSMEEASALANKVGIISKQLLAVGSTDELAARFATYEVHFPCRTREEALRAQQLMSRISEGSRMADDVATRFEVPVEKDGGVSLARLFHLLAEQGDFAEYTVEKVTLESVFLKVIRQNNVLEEDSEHTPHRRRRKFW